MGGKNGGYQQNICRGYKQINGMHNPPKGSGILQEAIRLTPCSKGEATHFVLCHHDKIKFIIDFVGGSSKLRKNVTAYNKKLALLILLLPIIPWRVLQITGLGYFARVELHHSIRPYIPPNHNWNILIGTYDETQKIVFQCFSSNNEPCTFIKVGNKASDVQLQREINFLRDSQNFSTFQTPLLLNSVLLSEEGAFNIQATQEFQGKQIRPIFNAELYNITREIAGSGVIINGEPYTFSHGDFAPWNIRKTKNGYIVFDWEHCGLRPVGYDAAYFIIMVEIALHKRSFDEAFKIAQAQINKYDNALQLNYHLIRLEFAKTTKTLKF